MRFSRGQNRVSRVIRVRCAPPRDGRRRRACRSAGGSDFSAREIASEGRADVPRRLPQGEGGQISTTCQDYRSRVRTSKTGLFKTKKMESRIGC